MEKKLKEDEQNDLMSPTETNKTLISSPKGETLNIEESPLKNDVPVKPQLKLNEVENEDTLATEEPPASFELEPDSYIYLMMTSRRIRVAASAASGFDRFRPIRSIPEISSQSELSKKFL